MNELKKVKLGIANLKKNLPKEFCITSLSHISKIPFKALSWREALIHRAAELSSKACDLYERNQILSSAILARSLMETVSLIVILDKKIKESIKNNLLNGIDAFLMRGAFGTQSQEMPVNPLRIGKIVEETNEIYSGFRETYNHLTEFSHPNYMGTFGCFGNIDKKNMKVVFGSYIKKLPTTFIISCIVTTLKILEEHYNNISYQFEKFIHLCENNSTK